MNLRVTSSASSNFFVRATITVSLFTKQQMVQSDLPATESARSLPHTGDVGDNEPLSYIYLVCVVDTDI